VSRFLALLALGALTACSGAASGPSEAVPQATPTVRADASNRAPDSPATPTPDPGGALPGEHAQGLPGEHAQGLPGARFACAGLPPVGAARCTIAVSLSIAANPDPALPASLIPGLHPADLQSAYNLPSSNAGGVVAVVDAFDDPAAEADLAVYRAAFGLPACTTANGCFRKVNQHGLIAPYPAPDAGWAQEIALDLDMVSAACPKCSILLVEADSALVDDLGASVDTAVALGAVAVGNESAVNFHYKHPGVAITASSGDRGYPSFPAASHHVTAVGGTTLARTPAGWAETFWKYTGNGCSKYIPKPAWQAVAPCSTRAAVDMSAVADPQTGVSTFVAAAGGWFVAGGTSVGAPLIAAAYALSGNPAEPGYSYAHTAGFRRVGAAAGYTIGTGLGSPYGVAGL
jgi:hypothetical protein